MNKQINLQRVGRYWELIIASNRQTSALTNNQQIYTWQFTAMTVNCQVLLVASDSAHANKVARDVQLQTQALEKKYNFYQQDSWLNQAVNNRSLSQVHLDAESLAIFTRVRELSQASQGIFDIGIGTIKKAARKFPQLSKQALFSKYQQALGLKSWQINGNFLQFNHSDTQFDLGGVVKEYSVDLAMALCKKQGISAGLINFGGDIISWGSKPDNSAFRVAIQHPKQVAKICGSISLAEQALASSGHYHRQCSYGNTQDSHIVAKQGIAQQVLSVSVLSQSVLTSGIFSTALSIKPSLVNSVYAQQHLKAIFIDEIHKTLTF